MHDIDRAKGLAILLVVFGHVVARQPPLGNEWYTAAKEAVYAFHMAFFMFLSGVVFFLRARPVSDFQAFATGVRKRFVRLMPAYFLFAGIVFAGKWGAQNFAHVDNPVTGWGGLLDIVLFPMQSVSAFLWYIYVLFLFSVCGLALLSITKGRVWPLVALGVALQFVPPVHFLGLGQFSKYFLFFALGGAAVALWESYARWVDRLWLLAMAGLIGVLAVGWDSSHGWMLAALLSIPALHGLCRREFVGGRGLAFVGAMSFSIYLMNTMAIGATKAVMLKFASWDGLNFVLLFFPMLMVAGVLLPILLKKYVFPKLGWLDRITS
ncbi:MAG: acyltransferase [Thiobacillus sp.]|uniref:acyltransferase family protein n=1 Tax=Thiobacillus sp. TaxID=924 RepID=UPI002734BFF0|nr:acyltransferase [Thiobacillus sp.]MDP3584438.1 acyltransferase [Thiobacillus sp.]